MYCIKENRVSLEGDKRLIEPVFNLYKKRYIPIINKYSYNLEPKDGKYLSLHMEIAYKNFGKKTYDPNKYRYIQPLSSKKVAVKDMNAFMTSDFETIVINGEHIPFCAAISYPNSRMNLQTVYVYNDNFSDVESFLLNYYDELNRCLSKARASIRKSPVVYFHNMKFDIIFIMQLLKILLDKKMIGADEVKTMYRKSNFYRFKMGKFIFKDSFKLLNKSLSSLAKTFLDDDKGSIDINFTPESIIENKDQIIEYCKKDCNLLYEVLKKFNTIIFDEYGLNALKSLTISGLSYRLLRSKFLEKDTIQNSSNYQNHHTILRESYRGGLSTVIKPICLDGSLTVIDINSSYPHSMTKDLPVGIAKRISPNLVDLNRIDELFGFFYVDLYVKDMNFDIAPMVHYHNAKLCDITGELKGVTFFSEELKFILKNGGKVTKVHRFLEYERGKPLKAFVDEFYTKRKLTDDKVLDFIYKLVLNSAYGRFGLKDDKTYSFIVENEMCEDIRKVSSVNSSIPITEKYSLNAFTLNNKLSNVNKTDISSEMKDLLRENNITSGRAIQIAAAVTAYSRVHLIETAHKIQNAGGQIFYTDTDSLYFNGLNEEQISSLDIIDKKVLGKWGIEEKNCSGIFIQPKLYAIRSEDGSVKTVIKGLPKKVMDKYSDEQKWALFTDLYNGTPINENYSKEISIEIKKLGIYSRDNIEYKSKDFFDKRRKIYTDAVWTGTKPFHLACNTLQNLPTESIPTVNLPTETESIPQYLDLPTESIRNTLPALQGEPLARNTLPKIIPGKKRTEKELETAFLKIINSLPFIESAIVDEIIPFEDDNHYDNDIISKAVSAMDCEKPKIPRYKGPKAPKITNFQKKKMARKERQRLRAMNCENQENQK